MIDGADTTGAEGDLTRACASIGDEITQVADRQFGIHREHDRVDANIADCHEVVDGIVFDFLHRGRHRHW